MSSPQSDFDDTLGTLYGPVRLFCERMLGERQEAEDATQQTFLRAFRNWNQFKGRSTRKTWIFRIASNVCTRLLEHRRWGIVSSVAIDSQVSAEDSHPAAGLEQWEQEQEVQKALLKLTPAHRMVLVLFCVEELSHGEIADLLACPEGTVWSRLHHARNAFAEHLRKAGFGTKAEKA